MNSMTPVVFLTLFILKVVNGKNVELCSGFQNAPTYHLLDLGSECGVRNYNMSANQKIMGGVEAKLGEFPFIARILVKSKENEEKGFCGGSIINNIYILTAAHCFQEEYIKHVESGYNLFVRLGEHDIREKQDCENNICAPSAQDRDVEEVIVHKEYDDEFPKNDIALLRLKEQISFNTHVKPVCLPIRCEVYNEDLSNAFVAVAGWGSLRDVSDDPQPGTNIAHVLQKVLLPITSREGCSEDWKGQILDTQICAGGTREHKRGQDTCQGDSGGPMTHLSQAFTPFRDVQVGLVSGGEACDEEGTDVAAGIYTRVSAYIPWILHNIRE